MIQLTFNPGLTLTGFRTTRPSSIASGNKLTKMIRFPQMWRYRWFRWYHVCLLNCTWIRWCIIETSSGLPEKSSAIFGSLRKSSEIFGNFLKMFGNFRLAFETILENLRKSSEGGRKSSENHQKRRQQYAYIIKRTLQVSSKIWILCSCHENIKFISSRYRVISSIYLMRNVRR